MTNGIVNYHFGGDQPTHLKVYNAMDGFHPWIETKLNEKLYSTN
jgi:hypothetical protein